jgi:hypothetical protein
MLSEHQPPPSGLTLISNAAGIIKRLVIQPHLFPDPNALIRTISNVKIFLHVTGSDVQKTTPHFPHWKATWATLNIAPGPMLNGWWPGSENG